MRSALSFGSFLLLTVSSVLGATVNYNFRVENKKIAPDGFKRSTTVVNGVYPNPLITVNKGDIIKVNVTNALTDPSQHRTTSIHWHGLFQGRHAQYDGPAFVTQCPISPELSFQYVIPTSNQAGTFWYHSHIDLQYIDGLRGPIVVKDPSDPYLHMYDVDNEDTVIQLGDWYHKNAIDTLNDVEKPNAGLPFPDSATINGLGRYKDGPATPRFSLNVSKDKRYRLRIINTSSIAGFNFSIEAHKLTVIAADGVNHKPLTVDYIEIWPGQRIDAILAANQKAKNYWMNTPMTTVIFPSDLTKGVVHYDGAPDADPTTPQTGPYPSGVALKEYKMVPRENPTPPGQCGAPDLVFNFDSKLAFDHKKRPFFKLGGIQYSPPDVPTLLKIMAGAHSNSSFTKTEHTIVLPRNKVIEIHLKGDEPHPFHLHGHTFSVMQSGSGGSYNCVNPPQRDVTTVFPNRTSIIRFATDNPGPWFFHCHIDWHLKMGLAAVFVEDPATIKKITKPTAPDFDHLCPAYKKLDPSFY